MSAVARALKFTMSAVAGALKFTMSAVARALLCNMCQLLLDVVHLKKKFGKFKNNIQCFEKKSTTQYVLF
jgi:hypothetical protein